jgi:FkbM family methyltransferase
MNRFLQRILKTSTVKSPSAFDAVTEADLYYCYRLLLNREPDEAGLDFWMKQIRRNQHTLKSLTDSFINTPEFLIRREHTLYSFFMAAARQIQLVQLKHFKMYARSNDLFIGAAIIRGDPYEAHVVREMQPLLKPGIVFFDIGANIGYFSLMAASMIGSEGKVISFEPNLDNCELLKLSIQTNQFENIQLYPYAVADKEQHFLLQTFGSNGWVTPVHDQPKNNGQPVDSQEPEAIPANSYLVKTVALDDFLSHIDRVDVIKMDIEGAELSAFQGMRNIVRKCRPVIFSEFAPAMIEQLSGVPPEMYLDTLQELSYDIYVIEHDRCSATPQSSADIMNYYANSGMNHIDLVAYPTP